MKRIDFNSAWTVKCLTRDEPEILVNLPHDAMITEPRSSESRGEGNIAWFLGGDYEYRKNLFVPENWFGKCILLEFEAVYQCGEVYINGEKAAFRPYGYTNFFLDAAKYLKYGENNEVRVIARNADQPNSRWYSGTGLYRPAWIWLGEEAHIPVNGVKVKTVSISPATIEVEVKTSLPGMVNIEILSGSGVVKTFAAETNGNRVTVQLVIKDAKLWSCDTPYLYTLRASFGNDVVEESFGIRLLQWEPDNGLTINGERVILKGACVHHDHGVLGACAFPEAEWRKVRIMKENGYNALRSSHYPCSKAFLDACDRQGVLVMDEYVDVWYIHKTEHDYANYMLDWWQQDLQEMVDKDFNHPCVIMYSTGNEVSETAQKKGIELTGRLTRYLHQLDATRPVTCGINIFFNFLSSIGLGVYSDEKAKKEAEAAKTKPAQKPEKKKAVGSEFYNVLSLVIGDWFMKAGATLPPCDYKTRDAYANMDIAGYNYGIFRYRKDLKNYPERLILGSETLCKDAYGFWEIAKENKRLIGDFVWPGMDYMGEVNTGGPEFEDYNTDSDPATRLTGSCGRVDLIGKPRAEAAFTKVALEIEPGPRIGVIPVYEDHTPHINGWMVTKAVESWSWRGCEGRNAHVEVYARAYAVELLLEGRRVAKKRVARNSCRTMFDIPYASGELTAVSFDKSGKEIGRSSLTTAGERTRLSLLPEEAVVKPGGLAFIRLEYTDENGIWKPMERHMLSVTVENGTLAGLGSACPYKKGSFGLSEVETYFGDALAVVRSDGSGDVVVRVKDETDEYSINIPCEV